MACRELSQIEAVRRDLAAWSERQPKPVQNAAANLGGWLDIAGTRSEKLFWDRNSPTVDVLACTARALERLRAAVTNTQHHQVS